MLTGIGLRNFKAFGDEMQEAPLSKITLIYGPNSGGKSSIIQALLLLKQSLRGSYANERRSLIPRGDLVDLGSLQSLLHKHDVERVLELSLRFVNYEQGAIDSVHMKFFSSGTLSNLHYMISSIDSGDVLFSAAIEGEMPETFKFRDRSLDWNARFRIMEVDGERVLYHFSEDFLPTLGFCELEHTRLQVRLQVMQRLLENSRIGLRQTDAYTLGQEFDLASMRQEYERIRMLEGTREQALEQARARANQTREEILELKQSWAQQQIMVRLMEEGRAQTLGEAFENAMERAKQEVDEHLDPTLRQLQPNSDHVIALTPENIPSDYEHHLQSVNYLGPLRSPPERLYSLSSTDNNAIGIQGEFSANVLYRSEDVRETLNEWFEQFDIPYELNVLRLGEASLAGEHIIIALKDKRTDTQVTLADVGYGVKPTPARNHPRHRITGRLDNLRRAARNPSPPPPSGECRRPHD